MNLPNKLSLARVAMIPLMVVLMLPNTALCNYLAAAVFALAAFTDFLDGHIARSRHIVTDFGKFIDPVADKLLTLSALIMLVQCGLMPAWVVVVILARELSVDGLRMVAATKGRVIAAGKLGKVKTVSQIVLILWLMVTRQPVVTSLMFDAASQVVVVAESPASSGPYLVSSLLTLWTIVITLWSGVEYFTKNGGMLKEMK